MNAQIDKEEGNNRNSQSSINSHPELKEKKIFFLRIMLIIINLISLISGTHIYQNRNYYLSKEYKFLYSNSLFIFIIMYTLGMIGTLIFSFLLSVLLKIITLIINIFIDDNKIPLNKNEEKHSENSFVYINSNSNQFSAISYTFTLFIITTTIIYFLSLPYSIFLLIFMNKNEYYSNSNDFPLLYFFVIINTIAGFILFYVLLIIVFAKREGSFRQRSFFIDDNNLNVLRNEIRQAMEKAEN